MTCLSWTFWICLLRLSKCKSLPGAIGRAAAMFTVWMVQTFGMKAQEFSSLYWGWKKIVQRCKGGKTGLPIVLGWYNGLVRQDASSYDMKILVQHSFGVLRVRAKSHNTRTACRAIIFHRVSRSKYRSSTVFFSRPRCDHFVASGSYNKWYNGYNESYNGKNFESQAVVVYLATIVKGA